MPATSRTTRLFCNTLTRLLESPRITGCPTAGPKLFDETPAIVDRCSPNDWVKLSVMSVPEMTSTELSFCP